MPRNYCELFVALCVALFFALFVVLFVGLSVWKFCLQVLYRMLQIKIHQFYVKEDLLSLLRVYKKSSASAQTDGRIAADGPLYTGIAKLLKTSSTHLFSELILSF